MARRGLRKPQTQRRSLRPRTSQYPVRSSAPPGDATALAPDAAEPDRSNVMPLSSSMSRASATEPLAGERAPVAPEPARNGANGHGHAHAHGHDDFDHAPVHEEHEHLASSFFARQHHDHAAHDAWEDPPLPMMTLGSRRAMYATLGLLAVSALLLVGYLAYERLIMPVPAELGRGHGLPPPVASATTQRIAAQPRASASPPPASIPSTAAPSPALGRSDAPPLAPAAAVAAAPQATPGVSPGAAVLPIAQPAASAAAASVPAAQAIPRPVAPSATPVPAAQATPQPVAPSDTPLPAAQASATQGPAVTERVDPETRQLLAAANTLYEHRQRRAALAAYQQIIAREPNTAEALSKLAFIYLDLRDNEHARSFAARAVEVDPTSSEGWIVLGAANEGLGDRAAARAAYRSCAAQANGPYSLECRRLGR